MSARTQGFSLLEVLLAMTLLSLLGALAAGGIRFGAQAWERAQDQSDTMVEYLAVERFLRNQIAAARPIRLADGSREPPVIFEGSGQSLTFAAPVRAALGPPGLHLIEIMPDTGQDAPALVMAWTPIGQADLVLDVAPRIETLSTQQSSVRLRYFGLDAEGIPRWQDTWSGRADLPMLVEIVLLSRAGAPETPIVVAMDAHGRTSQ